MSEQPGSVRPGGRTARTREAVLDAVLTELAEGGYAVLSVESVARRAGVHPATVYRRWRTVEGLVIDLLIRVSERAIPIPDTGQLDSDLHALAAGIARFYANDGNRALIEAIITAAARNPSAGRALHDFFDGRLRQTAQIVHRAIDRGEVPSDTDAKEVIATLGAPFYYRLLITRGPIDLALAARAADIAHLAARTGALSR